MKIARRTYKGLKVRLLRDIIDIYDPRRAIIAHAGDVVEVESTSFGRHHIHIEGRFILPSIKIEETEIAY